MHRRPAALLRPAPLAFLISLLAGAWMLLGSASAPAAAGPVADGRVIVLGFDGGDYRTAAALAEAGRMPNVARLAGEGTFAPLGTTYSAESPVAWASLNTGQNPSKTGVPGFVKRDLVLPDGSLGDGGAPSPAIGHQRTEERQVVDLDAGPLIGFLARFDGTVLMAIVGVGVLLVFLVAFKLLLRLKLGLALGLSIVLAAAGAVGAKSAKQYVPQSVPGIVANPVEVDAFWDHAARAGSKVVVLDAAMAWDKPAPDGAKVLGGLGVPDCRGDNGQWFVYTTSEDEIDKEPVGRKSATAGTIFRVPSWRNGKIECALYGPKNFYEMDLLEQERDAIEAKLAPPSQVGWKEGSQLRERKKEIDKLVDPLDSDHHPRATAPVVIEQRDGGARITIDGQTQDLDDGVWSDFYRLSFELNPLIKAHAVTRVKILENGDAFTLFVNTLDIDPANPQFWQPVSQPKSFSGELSSRIGGAFETFGWACLTMPFKDRVIDVETMLQDLEFTMKWREKVTRAALEEGDFDALMSVFGVPDRVQHMCYQYYDPEHPLYDEAKASQVVTFFDEEIQLREVIPTIYEQIDRIVGWVSEEYLEDGDTLLVCADHGFQSFRHQVHLNNWLAREGYLKVQEGLPSTRMNQALMFVDWSETKAYAMGLGMIYLNLEGREKNGIVKPAESRALLEEIAGKLEALTDDRDGGSTPAVEQVTFIDDVHDGPYRDREGDLMVGFKPYYRVSWGTTSGGTDLDKDASGSVVAGPIFEANDNNWSGGHVSVAPKHVAGMFLSNRQVQLPADGVHLLHIAPTTLELLGHERPSELDREALEVH